MKQKSIIAFVLMALAISPVVIAASDARYYGKEPLISSKEEPGFQGIMPYYVKTKLVDSYEKINEKIEPIMYKITRDEVPEPSNTIKEIEVKTNAERIDDDTQGISYSYQNLGNVRTTFTFKTLLLKYNFETKDWEIIQEQLYEDVTLDPGMGIGEYTPMDLEPGYYVTGIKIATDFHDLIEINNNDYETFMIYPLNKGQENPIPLVGQMKEEPYEPTTTEPTATVSKELDKENVNKLSIKISYITIWEKTKEIIGLS